VLAVAFPFVPAFAPSYAMSLADRSHNDENGSLYQRSSATGSSPPLYVSSASGAKRRSGPCGVFTHGPFAFSWSLRASNCQ